MTTAATAATALTRIRSQRPGAAIRAVRRSAAGHGELEPLIDDNAIACASRLPNEP